VVLKRSAFSPLAVLLVPVVLAFKVFTPTAVLDAIAPAPLPTRTPDRVASAVEEIAPVTARPAVMDVSPALSIVNLALLLLVPSTPKEPPVVAPVYKTIPPVPDVAAKTRSFPAPTDNWLAFRIEGKLLSVAASDLPNNIMFELFTVASPS